MSKMMYRLTMLLALMAAVFMTACEKEATAGLEDEAAATAEAELRGELGEPHGGPEGTLGRPGCIRLVFPLTIGFPDGESVQVQNLQEMKNTLRTWRQDNPDATERPQIAFPHDIELPGGAVVTVNNREQLLNFLRRCSDAGPHRPHREAGPCFQLIFPLSISFPDGASAEAADRLALAEAVRAWREANPDAEGRPEIAFPYQVRLRNGTLATIDSDDDLRALLNGCWDDRPASDDERCFKLVFPVTLSFPDGSVESAEDPQQLHELIREWREEHPDAEGRPEIAFPQKIALSDGSVVEVGSRDELAEIVGDCWDDRPYDRPCFRLVYPLTVEMPGGIKVTVNDPAQLHRVIKARRQHGARGNRRPELVYPIEIMFADGSTQTIASAEALKTAREACGDE